MAYMGCGVGYDVVSILVTQHAVACISAVVVLSIEAPSVSLQHHIEVTYR